MRSTFVLSAAIVLDAGLLTVNLFVAELSGSRAVYSQAVFNAADMVGLAMLTWGYFASRRPPDIEHPFGYGKERFFWAFSASLVTFSLSGFGVLAAGLQQSVDPTKVTDVVDGLAVVGATLVASVIGVLIVLRELSLARRSVASLIVNSEQGIKTIFYQDLVAAAGSVVAFGGLLALYRTGDDRIDGNTATIVGVMMFAAGVALAAEARPLLVGRAVDRREAGRVLGITRQHPRVREVRSVQSMMLGPEDALIALKVNFQDGLTTDELERAIDEISSGIRAAVPLVRHLIIEPES